eukprot:m.1300335 g.1300335  ORF g.1300335 m.1300335 type:complete len:99 (-) comp24802_c1_seq18:80-376(-)
MNITPGLYGESAGCMFLRYPIGRKCVGDARDAARWVWYSTLARTIIGDAVTILCTGSAWRPPGKNCLKAAVGGDRTHTNGNMIRQSAKASSRFMVHSS